MMKTFAFEHPIMFQSNHVKNRPYGKKAALNYSLVRIENSLTNLVFELKILNNLLS